MTNTDLQNGFIYCEKKTVGNSEVTLYSKKGTSCLTKNNDQQKHLFYTQSGSLLVLTMTDGENTSGLWGQRLNDYLTTFIISNGGIRNMNETLFPDRMKSNILQSIRDYIWMFMREKKLDIESMKSTLLVFACDLSQNAFFSFHIGDGMLLGIDKTDELHIISLPDLGITLNKTHYIYDCLEKKNENSFEYVRFNRGELCSFNRVFLVSNRVSMLVRGRHVTQNGQALMKKCSDKEIIDVVNRFRNVDDASFVLLKIHRE